MSAPVEDQEWVIDTIPAAPPEPDDLVDIIDVLIPLFRAKRLVVMSTAACCLVGAMVAAILKPTYTAEAVIMPPQQQSSSASLLMSQLGSLGSLGGASALGLKSPADMFIGIVQSRTIADDLIRKLNLRSVYGTSTLEEARKKLAGSTDAKTLKDGLIHITVDDHDPMRAAAIANGYIDELYAINSRLAIGEAAQRRLFFDEQLSKENVALVAAEDAMKKTEEKTGVIQLSGQAQLALSSIANLQAQIASRQVQLGVARTFATDDNPDVQRLLQEIASLKSELAARENKQQVPGNVQVPTGSVPSVGLEYLRAQRDVQYHEALFELLSKQRELASLDEAKSAPLIQVVDSAVVPERKSGPSRVLIAFGSAIAGFILAVMWVFARATVDGMRRDPRQAHRLHELMDALQQRH